MFAVHTDLFVYTNKFILLNNLTNNNFLWGMPADEYNTSIQYKPNFGKMFQNTVWIAVSQIWFGIESISFPNTL